MDEQNKSEQEIVWQESLDSVEQGFDVIGRLFTVSQPEAVFAEPIEAEGYTVITASEAYVAMGVGFGAGSGVEPGQDAGNNGTAVNGTGQDDPAAAVAKSPESIGKGAGGGGGGLSIGRPVAAIVIGREGVTVQPIIDLTKIGLAFFTMLGSVAFLLSRMRRHPK